MWARFDLLTSFHQENRSVDEWYNAVQAHVWFAKYPQETANIVHHDTFWFLKDEEFCLKPSMTVVLILTKFMQGKSGSLQRKWKHQRQQCNTSSKLQVTPKQLKSIWWDISGQTSHQANIKEKLSSQDHPVIVAYQWTTSATIQKKV